MEFGPDWNPDCWFKDISKEPARASGETTETQLENQSNISHLTSQLSDPSQPSQPTENIRTSFTRQQRLEGAKLRKRNKRKQKFQHTERRKLKRRVQEFASRHPVCQPVPLFFGDSGQSNPVDEIAKGLIGQYLFSRESNLVIRILETEAYLESEPLYLAKFERDTPMFKIAAGTLLSWSSPSFNQPHLVLTAGDNSSGDVVFLRSCETTHGLREIRSRLSITGPTKQSRRANLLLGPVNVAKALLPELTGNCNVLDATGGIHLLQKESTGQIIMQGKRVLPMDTSVTYSELPGADKEYRFALSMTRMKYKEKSHLHPSGDVL